MLLAITMDIFFSYEKYIKFVIRIFIHTNTYTHICAVLCEAMAQAMAKEKFFFVICSLASALCGREKKRKGANSNEAESFLWKHLYTCMHMYVPNERKIC